MAPTIRPATAADQDTIRRIIREANLNRMSLHWRNFLIVEEDGAIVGIGQVKPHGDGSRELASLAVVPDRQSQGIGATLVNSLLAREHGVIHLTCQSRMHGYYERFGFRRLELRDYPPYFRRLIPIVNLVGRLFKTRIVVMRREAG